MARDLVFDSFDVTESGGAVDATAGRTGEPSDERAARWAKFEALMALSDGQADLERRPSSTVGSDRLGAATRDFVADTADIGVRHDRIRATTHPLTASPPRNPSASPAPQLVPARRHRLPESLLDGAVEGRIRKQPRAQAAAWRHRAEGALMASLVVAGVLAFGHVVLPAAS